MGPLLIVLGVVFVILKLLGIIAWSWWLVMAPFIAMVVLMALVLVFFSGFFFTAMALTAPHRNRSFWR